MNRTPFEKDGLLFVADWVQSKVALLIKNVLSVGRGKLGWRRMMDNIRQPFKADWDLYNFTKGLGPLIYN